MSPANWALLGVPRSCPRGQPQVALMFVGFGLPLIADWRIAAKSCLRRRVRPSIQEFPIEGLPHTGFTRSLLR
jgi:hypothetical protein